MHTDPRQHHNIVYISTQLKQINGKLDAYQSAMQTVQQLSLVVVDMKEKMESMEQLLHSLLENQQVVIMDISCMYQEKHAAIANFDTQVYTETHIHTRSAHIYLHLCTYIRIYTLD